MRTTPQQRRLIAEMRERNWSKASIAENLRLSLGTVSHWLLVQGAEAKKLPPRMARRTDPIVRGGRLVHPFTSYDDALLTALRIQGYNFSQIARHLTKRDPQRPRNPATIKYRLLTLARQEERYGARDNG